METRGSDEAQFAKDLLKAGLVTEAQLRTATEYQASLGGSLRTILLKLGFVSEERLSAFIARREHLPTIDIETRPLDVELMARIPRETIERHRVLPFRLSESSVLLVMSEPMGFQAIEEIRFITGKKVEMALAPASQIQARITRYYAERRAAAPVEQPDTAKLLIEQIADPNVAALARALLRKGVISADEWQLERG
ncbi:MAG: hypothetical protein ACKVX7_01535 [Planctomycetota bacterium]